MLTQNAITLLQDLIQIESFSKKESGTAQRLEHWFEEYKIPFQKKDNNLKADMMYDLVKDPNENKNISENKENYSNIIKFQHLLDSVRSLN